MKILAINASHRGDKGYSRFLLDKLAEGANDAGATLEVITLAGMKVERCRACGKCHTVGHHLTCVFDKEDDVSNIFRRMANADIVIYATPVYVFGMSGLMKTFLDRMYSTGDVSDLLLSKSGLIFHHINKDICSKPFVTLVCCDNLESETPKNVLNYFKTFSKFMDAHQVGILVRNGGRMSGHGKDPEKEKLVPKIHHIYEAYIRAGRELATKGQISSSTQRRANREIVPSPLFGVLKRVPFKPLKRQFVKKAREMQELL